MITFSIKSWQKEGKGRAGKEKLKEQQQQQQLTDVWSQTFWELCVREGEKNIDSQTSVVLFLAKEDKDSFARNSFISPFPVISLLVLAKLKVKRFTLEITGVQLLLKNRWVLFQAWPQAITKAGLMGESCPPTQPCCTVRALQSLQGVAVRPQHPLSTPPSVGRADMFGNLMPQPLHLRPSSGASAETSSWGKLEETMKIPLSVPRTYPFLALPPLAVYPTQAA